ncbi:GPI ethanolamine phosphate transferase [Phytophthora megakarya]|uniref:GPI ethanolamine phosphate transferase n=1 Tax=Phytophthora megakarya TaxID=4795 RepID=A0A225WUW6_9STRA|nr:GPI ethanolamine phosphate transferase [Phytophthora megakarya]
MGHSVLVALFALHAAALYLFTTGFFLTRFEVSDRCWMPRRFRRVVFVVIDALRFDFAATGSSAQRSTFYSDRLPILNETLIREPEHALLLKFVADPPTMTMQRLKGLTTGSLPTFLDIKDNMAASSQIVEDNLLRQLRAQERGVVFMGDDTWDSLYAREFTRKFAFDSFNVKDLHSVDRGVTAHLFPELQNSVFMAEKLDEMNDVLAKLLQTLKDMPDGDDVLLAVLGDHGMSADGNHGGASDDETGAALFLYSKASLVATGVTDHDEAKELKKYAEKIIDNSREVPQVDLVPTLALLSGLPIPFGNLGSVIPSLFFFPPSPSESGETGALAAFQTLNRALRLNLDQVRRYLFRYSSASKLPERAYDQLEKLFVEIQCVEEQLEQVHGNEATSTHTKADFPLLLRLHEDLVNKQQRYLREALSLGRSIWTQFDLYSMGWGMIILMWAFVSGATSIFLRSESWDPPLSVAGIVGGLFFICPASINVPLLPAAPLSRGLVTASCVGLVDLTSHFVFRLESKSSTNAPDVKPLGSSISVVGVVAALIVVLHALALLSNSYIVAEANVMQFLSATTGFFLLVCALRLKVKHNLATSAALSFIFATRLSSAVEPPNIIKASSTTGRTFLPLVVIAALALGSSVQIMKYTGQKMSLVTRLILVSSLISYCVCGIFWAASPIKMAFWRLWLPRLVFLIFLGTLVGLVVHTLQSKSKNTTGLAGQVPTEHLLLFWQLVPAFMVVLGPTSPLTVLCLVVQYLSFAIVVTCRRFINPVAFGNITPWVLLWASCSYQAFFTTGHANTFTSLQNASGFVGFDIFNFYVAGTLLGLNTFGCFALAVLALPWLNLQRHQPQSHTSKMLLAFSTYFSCNAAVSTLFVALQRRHLMVWAIFAPKFIFDGVVLLVIELLLLVFTPLNSNHHSLVHVD